MKHAFAPMEKQSLADRLAREIRESILAGTYARGDRLPSIMEMAKRFGVGHPTLREALKTLEAMGMVEIRHGSGVYVARNEDQLLHATPDFAGRMTKKLLLDLIAARMPLEMLSAAEAVRHEFADHLQQATADPEEGRARRSRHEDLHQRALAAARQTVFRMRADGDIGDAAFHRLEEEFDWVEMSNGASR